MKYFSNYLFPIHPRKLFLIILIMSLCHTSGCLYSNVTSPLDTNVTETRLGSKIGRSKARSVLYLVAWGDAGVAKAAKNGDLKVVHHLDVEVLSVLFGVYSEVSTIAYGD